MAFNEFFNKAVDAISEKHAFNERISLLLAPLKSLRAPTLVEPVVVPIARTLPKGSVAGVDSGFVSKKLSFIDLVLIKTAGVVFEYEQGALKKTTYYPKPYSFPEPMMLRAGLEKDEEAQSVSLLRLEQEVSCAIAMIEKFKPNFLFIDGSIVPQYQDKPRKDSEVNEEYSSIVELFQKLYLVAETNACTLVACVEDSRGTRFRQILQDELLPQSKSPLSAAQLQGAFDASILDYYLQPGERTFAFPYTNTIANHAILKDYKKEWAQQVFVFYLKCSLHDKPLRVEFLNKELKHLKEKSDMVAQIVFALSALHKEYSFPSVLIEADLRAGLNEQEISVVYDRLVDKLGSKIRMRRSNRPFG